MEAARPRGRRRRARRGTVDRPLNTRLVRVSSLVAGAGRPRAPVLSLGNRRASPPPARAGVRRDGRGLGRDVSSRRSSPRECLAPTTPQAPPAGTRRRSRSSGSRRRRTSGAPTSSISARSSLLNIVTVIPGRSEEADRSRRPSRQRRHGSGERRQRLRHGGAHRACSRLRSAGSGARAAPEPHARSRLDRRRRLRRSRSRPLRADVALAEEALAAIVLDDVGGRRASAHRARGRRLELAGADARPDGVRTRFGSRPGKRRRSLRFSRSSSISAFPSRPPSTGRSSPRAIAAISLTTRDPASDRASRRDCRRALSERRLGQLGRATEALVGSIDASVGAAFRTPDSVFLDDRAASGWTVRLALVVAIVPFALGVLDLLVRGRRRALPFRPALRALRTRMLFWLWAGVLLWVGALTGVLPDRGRASAAAGLVVRRRSERCRDSPCWPLRSSSAGCSFAGRSFPSAQAAPVERLAGYTCALAWLGVVALVVALTKPFALAFVLPSLYAWLWLPLQARLWPRVGIYLLGLLGPIGGLLLLGREVGLGPADASALCRRARHRRLHLALLGAARARVVDGGRAVGSTCVRPLRAVRRRLGAAPTWTHSHCGSTRLRRRIGNRSAR